MTPRRSHRRDQQSQDAVDPQQQGKLPYLRFYPGDEERDVGVRTLPLDAFGLWKRMQNYMHDGKPYGHLTHPSGEPITVEQLANLVGQSPSKVRRLLTTIEERHVSSRTEGGVIFSRRMVRDADRRRIAKENGGKGGNPNLRPAGVDAVNSDPRAVVNPTPPEDGDNPPLPKAVASASGSGNGSGSPERSLLGRIDSARDGAVARESAAEPSGEPRRTGNCGRPEPSEPSRPSGARPEEPTLTTAPSADLPAEAERFLAHFYGSAPVERRADVRAQLAAVLAGPGAWVGRGRDRERVQAVDARHLAEECVYVVGVGGRIDDQDKAIVWLLKALQETADTYRRERAADAGREQEKRDAKENALVALVSLPAMSAREIATAAEAERDAASRWIEEPAQGQLLQELTAQAQADVDRMMEGVPLATPMQRRQEMRQGYLARCFRGEVLKAYRAAQSAAGAPQLAHAGG